MEDVSAATRIVGKRITARDANDIIEKGYVVCDGIFGKKKADKFREEIKTLARTSQMIENRVRFGKSIFTKPNIFEVDLHDASLRKKTTEFNRLFHDNCIVKRLKVLLPSLGVGSGSDRVTVKLQWNRGRGGCFPLHYDNPGRPSNRLLTCLVYLNPDWTEGDGGELELIPFLSNPQKIAPLHDRMVIFRSDRVLHRVLQATRERFCFTIWIDGSDVNSDDDVFLKSKHLQTSAVEFLKRSPLQRVLSRAVYDEEYVRSIVECMGEGTDASLTMLASHRMHVASLRNNSSLATFLGDLRERKPRALSDCGDAHESREANQVTGEDDGRATCSSSAASASSDDAADEVDLD